jgi:hypothetical protein
LGSLILLPLEHALGDSRHCRVMTSLDGVERLGETPVVVMNLRRPLDVRSLCIISATAARSSVIFIQKADIIAPLLDGYSEPAWIGKRIGIADATVCAILNRRVRDRHGERDIRLI